MNAAHFQLVSFDGLPWPLIGAVLLLTPVLMRLPGILLALGVLVRERSQAQLRRVVAERITAAAPEADDLVKMLGAVMDGSPPAAGQPAEDVPVARPGPPAVPPPREEPPPRE
jgi:hypothetical protein